MKRERIHPSEIDEWLDYDNGVFRWKKARGSVSAGKVAGTINGLGYRYICLMGRMYLAHRLVWALFHGKWPDDDKEIDHRDGHKANNHIDNLRLVTRSQNIIYALRSRLDPATLEAAKAILDLFSKKDRAA